MNKFNIGDLVVLKSGSMRMCVEECTEDEVATVWCNEGQIGRDRFSPALLSKWEHREDRSGGDRGPRGAGGGKPYGGGREGGGKPYGGGGGRDRDRGGDDDRPPRKTGWDGKPRDKKYFRKDD